MAKLSYSPDVDQHDSKIFRESLGTLGTTTVPGGNQLQELQAKIRQGVKHVELHLNSRGKGQFNANDVPDKYGFEQRRTIMQLAKLNNQTLSVHSSLDVTSFSGLTGQQGFDESSRWDALKEMDETVKFAAETAKSGAIVMHLQGEGLQSSRSELTLSKRYLQWLKDNGKDDELERLKKDYLKENPLDRLFVDNPMKKDEIKREYERLSNSDKKNFERRYKEEIDGRDPAELYYIKNQQEKKKVGGLANYVAIGDQLAPVERNQEFVNLKALQNKSNFTENEGKILDALRINSGESFSIDDFQKAMAIFTGDEIPKDLSGKISQKEFFDLKSKLVLDYDKILKNNNYVYANADTDFFKETNELQKGVMDLQKKRLNVKHSMFKDELERVKKLEKENRDALAAIEKFDEKTEEGRAARDAIKMKIAEKNRDIQALKYQVIGQEDYHELAQYDESISKINKNIKELEEKSLNAASIADESFNRNVSGVAYLGLKALRYQLDLKDKSKKAKEALPKLNGELSDLEKRYDTASSSEERDRIADEISRKKREIRNWVGVKDYVDIDIDDKPLYVSPENMLPGMGNLTSIEDFKSVIRVGQDDFAEKLLGDEDFFKRIREDYEKETGKKVTTKNQALEIAKKHLSGTLDTAHAGAWLKHFKRNEDESEEQRLERFNKWLADQAESMVKEGLVKHVHFNDTQGKDDDHNMIGAGVLDMHELKHRLRKAGVKEPLIVEAGGRMNHIGASFDLFNPTLQSGGDFEQSRVSSGVSDWISVDRNYQRRPEYSTYGMGYSTFRHVPPQQGREKGEWSGTSFF